MSKDEDLLHHQMREAIPSVKVAILLLEAAGWEVEDRSSHLPIVKGESHPDDADLFARRDGGDWKRVEVKRRTFDFDGTRKSFCKPAHRRKFPNGYPTVGVVSKYRTHKWGKEEVEPSAHFLFSHDLRYYHIVRQDSRPRWVPERRWDEQAQQMETLLSAPWADVEVRKTPDDLLVQVTEPHSGWCVDEDCQHPERSQS